MQSRLKSPVFWSSIVAQVLSILVLTGVIDAGQSDGITAVVTALLEAFTVFGLLNNPTNKNGF